MWSRLCDELMVGADWFEERDFSSCSQWLRAIAEAGLKVNDRWAATASARDAIQWLVWGRNPPPFERGRRNGNQVARKTFHWFAATRTSRFVPDWVIGSEAPRDFVELAAATQVRDVPFQNVAVALGHLNDLLQEVCSGHLIFLLSPSEVLNSPVPIAPDRKPKLSLERHASIWQLFDAVRFGGNCDEILIELGSVGQEEIADAWSKFSGWSRVRVDASEAMRSLSGFLPESIARENKIVVTKADSGLTFATSEADAETLEKLRFIFNQDVTMQIASRGELQETIDALYQGDYGETVLVEL